MANFEKKTEHVHIVISKSCKDFLLGEAERREQSLSEYLRELIITHSGYRRQRIAQALEDQ